MSRVVVSFIFIDICMYMYRVQPKQNSQIHIVRNSKEMRGPKNSSHLFKYSSHLKKTYSGVFCPQLFSAVDVTSFVHYGKRI